MLVDVIIVGSGVSGVAAALSLAQRGFRPTVLDVGQVAPPGTPLRGNFYRRRETEDCFDVMIGREYEQLRGQRRGMPPIPAKLTAPRMRFISNGGEQFSPLRQKGYAAIQSFAAGGLANAWGAGLYRCTDRDLQSFPIRAADLAPYYDRLTEEIGISGQSDDLAPFFGDDRGLQPPLRLSRKAGWLFDRYERKRSALNARGVFLGRPRLGVLSQPKDDRPACNYDNLEFWEPNLPCIYTPALTLRKLVDRGLISYRKGLLVESWSRSEGAITVRASNPLTGEQVSIRTRRLMLAAGAIGSARLALRSRNDFTTRLPLLDNPAIQVPMVLPRFIGSGLDTDCFGLTQLNLVLDRADFGKPVQASILEITSPARSEFYSHIPFAAQGRLTAIRYMVPAMLVMQVFLPGSRQEAASLRLADDGALEIEAIPAKPDPRLVPLLTWALRKLGAITHRSLMMTPPPGQGIHYAGTLAMSESAAGPYACDRVGRLACEPGVYVLDGSTFPSLPAKNYSLTMMANAMRIADHAANELEKDL